MITLGVGVIPVRVADPEDLLYNRGIRRCVTQFHPVMAATAGNDIVDRRQREVFMIQVPVLHGSKLMKEAQQDQQVIGHSLLILDIAVMQRNLAG
jgi:hypothetical protein